MEKYTPISDFIKRDSFKDAPSLDTQKIADLIQLSNESESNLFNELVEIYLQDTPPLISNIKESTVFKDCKRLFRFAHKIKGMSANLGAIKMVLICGALEELGRKDLMEETETLISEVENEHKKVLELLRQYDGKNLSF